MSSVESSAGFLIAAKRALKHEPPRWDEYFARLRAAARRGNADAQEQLGAWYLEGFNEASGQVVLRRSPKRALSLLESAAAGGNTSALFALGCCFDLGDGVARDPARAEQYYRQAARRGESLAALNLAVLYREKGDLRAAERWLRRAEAFGEPDAVLELGRMAMRNRWTTRRSHAAVARLRRLARRGGPEAPEAMLLIGTAHARGVGARLSPREAIRWFQRAGERGDAEVRALARAAARDLSAGDGAPKR